MPREEFKPGNMLYPLPAVMISSQRPGEKPNIITVAWAGTICSDPAMVSISVRPSRLSYDIIKETGEDPTQGSQKVVIAEDGTKQNIIKEGTQDSILSRDRTCPCIGASEKYRSDTEDNYRSENDGSSRLCVVCSRRGKAS